MRQLKIKTSEQQFEERVNCIYESFADYPSTYDLARLFDAYELISNALEISLNTVSVLVWAIKNDEESFSTSDVAKAVNVTEWEVDRAINELSRLSLMELHMDDCYRLIIKTSDVIMAKFKWHLENINNTKK